MSSYDSKAVQRKNIAEAEAEIYALTIKNDPVRVGRRIFIASLVEARYKQGLTQAELAKRAGLPQSTIARLETEKANPTLNTLLAISRALGVNLMVE